MLTIRGSAFIFALVLTFGCGANIATDIGQTRNGGTTDAGTCSGGTLYVPQDYGTIQQAVNVAPQASLDVPCGFQTTIVVATGEYKENIVVPARVNIMITGDKGSRVVINGGGETTITVGSQASFVLQTVTISSTAPYHPTIVAVHSSLIEFYLVTILGVGLGLETLSVSSVSISYSTFIGNGDVGIGNGYGVYLGQREFTAEHEPAYIYENTFQNWPFGIAACMGSVPSLSHNEPGDSNQYEQVPNPYTFVDTCQ